MNPFFNKNKHFLFLFPLLGSMSLWASEKATGTFKATSQCETYQSFKRKTNPSNVRLERKNVYTVNEVNSKQWNWVRITIQKENIQEQKRWVKKTCGIALITLKPKAASSKPKPSRKMCTKKVNQHDYNSLALTWLPGFCEHTPRASSKPECQALSKERLVVNHLTLHGLWPDKISCKKPYYTSCRNMVLDLTPETIDALSPWMPNFYFSQSLGRHEWKKHGTCQTLDDDEYFLLAKHVLENIDTSIIGNYIKDKVGEYLSPKAFQDYIKENVGEVASQRIQFQCTKKKIFKSLKIYLAKDIDLTRPLYDLLNQKDSKIPSFKHFTRGCAKKVYIEPSGPY
jgi:ribonuclease T2